MFAEIKYRKSQLKLYFLYSSLRTSQATNAVTLFRESKFVVFW
jgi:hypothetical protein